MARDETHRLRYSGVVGEAPGDVVFNNGGGRSFGFLSTLEKRARGEACVGALGSWGLQEYYGRVGEDEGARERAYGQPRRQPCSAPMADQARGGEGAS